MNQDIVNVLIQDATAKANLAILNIKVLLDNPVGVADHPNIAETIQGQLDEIATQQGRIAVLANVFKEKDDKEN